VDSRLYQQPSFRVAAGCEFRPGGVELTRQLAGACALQPGGRVLDLACGVGSTASYLSKEWDAKVSGLDASPEFLAEARERDEDVEWVVGKADALPFRDGWFDSVFAECFLSTFADPGPILREVRRVLRPGGRLAVSDMYLREPDAVPLGALTPAATCLSGARNKDATLAAFREHGLRVTVWEDRSEALKGLMASLIMAYGSAAAFWEAAAGDGADGAEGAGGGSAAARGAALQAARPGYYLVVAEASPSAPATVPSRD
jgi:arsenite methyltransferase